MKTRLLQRPVPLVALHKLMMLIWVVGDASVRRSLWWWASKSIIPNCQCFTLLTRFIHTRDIEQNVHSTFNVPSEFVSLWHKDIRRKPDRWKVRDFWGQLDADLHTSQQKHSHTHVLAVAQQHAANVCLLTTWAAECGALVELCFLSERTLQKRNCWKWKCFKATAVERSTIYCCTQGKSSLRAVWWHLLASS